MEAARFKFSQRTARFFENQDADFDLCLSNENKNTKRKTETDMRIFSSYLVSINEAREPETIPADELDRHLATYFSVIKKHDGNEYEPASLRGMLCSIERYLRSKNYPVSLTRDADFTNTRNMLKERQKLLRDLAKNDKGAKSDTIAISTVHRLNQLYLAKEFGPHNPSAVINALCFAFVVHLKIRKAIDHKQLLWGDIVLKISSTNDEYLCYEPLPGYEYCRLPLKGISGYRVLAQSPETSLWDPVSIYKLYRLRRPGHMMSPDSPFYLGIATPGHDSQQQPWFKPVAMGVNKLNDLVRMIRDITGTLVHGPTYSFDTYDTRDAEENSSRSPRYDADNENSRSRSNSRYDVHEPAADDESGDIYPDKHHPESIADDSFQTKTDNGHVAMKKNCDTNEFKPMKPTDVATEDAKEKIMAVLDDLASDTKADVITWLKSAFCAPESNENQKHKREFRKRIRMSIELDGDELDNTGSVEKRMKLQVIHEPVIKHHKNSVSDTEPAEDTQSSITAEGSDLTKTSSKSDSKDTIDPTFYNQLDSLHKMRQYVFKRALSCPSDIKGAKTPTTHIKDPHGDPNSSPKHTETSEPAEGDHANDQSAKMESHADTDGGDKVQELVTPVQGYNPYAAWALDPRFAMFMRSGFIQTYQDFVNLYSKPEVKDS